MSDWRIRLTDTPSHAFRCGLLGCWIVALRAWWWPGWPLLALSLGAFVIVPFGLILVPPREARTWAAFFWRAAVWLQLPGALSLLAATWWAAPGDAAALLALPWLFVTALVALVGLTRLLKYGVRPAGELSISFALIYLAVGGVWAVLACWGSESLQSTFQSLARDGGWAGDAARFGGRAFGFSELIIQLTAVHFHFAGFVLALLTGLAARARPGVEATVAVAGVIVGIPLVAVGINLTQAGLPAVEPWAAWLLAASGALTAVLHLWLAGSRPPLLRFLFTVSGVSLLLSMALAALYAWGRFSGIAVVEIPQMLPSHGALNAFGFAGPGLFAWLLAGGTITTPRGSAAGTGPPALRP